MVGPVSALKNSVFTAYLGPLLEKHKAKQDIIYEDLVSSKVAADQVLSKSQIGCSGLKEELESLHKTQMDAYQTKAEADLRAYILSKAPEVINIEEYPDDEEAFCRQCIPKFMKLASQSRPNYRLTAGWQPFVEEVLAKQIALRYQSNKLKKAAAPEMITTASEPEEGEEEEEEERVVAADDDNEADSRTNDGGGEENLDNEDEETEQEEGEEEETVSGAKLGISEEDVIMEEGEEDEDEEGEVVAGGGTEDEEDGELPLEDGQGETANKTAAAEQAKATSTAISNKNLKGKSQPMGNGSRRATTATTTTNKAKLGAGKKQLPARRKPLPAKVLLSGGGSNNNKMGAASGERGVNRGRGGGGRRRGGGGAAAATSSAK